jgi:glutathione synthase/RimK-type ligase-like ATP-grasp enzyme
MVPSELAVLCHNDDAQGMAVVASARKRGAAVQHLDACAWVQGGWSFDLVNAVEACPAHVVWVRSTPAWPAHLAARDAQWTADQWHTAVAVHADRERFALGMQMRWERRGATVIPSPSKRVDDHKPGQLLRWHDAGVRVPRTLVSQDPQRVRAFRSDVGDVIIKPLSGAGHAALAPTHIADDVVRACPALWQERIHGADVRVVVARGKIVGAGMKRVPPHIIDSRLDHSQWQPWTLTTNDETLVLDAAAALNHPLTAIDARMTAHGLVFLESNTCATWLDLEHDVHLPITERVTEALLAMRTVT